MIIFAQKPIPRPNCAFTHEYSRLKVGLKYNKGRMMSNLTFKNNLSITTFTIWSIPQRTIDHKNIDFFVINCFFFFIQPFNFTSQTLLRFLSAYMQRPSGLACGRGRALLPQRYNFSHPDGFCRDTPPRLRQTASWVPTLT
jgi:hypothetical protein